MLRAGYRMLVLEDTPMRLVSRCVRAGQTARGICRLALFTAL